eukprot:NODE_82_length_22625_cov_0.476516.p11 type:complete len:193 gc:universal NODE_82_length_22625_cov_0.476516:779-201(-)
MVDVILGLQHGNEVTDYISYQLSLSADIYCSADTLKSRYFILDGTKHVLQYLPSPIFRTNTTICLGSNYIFNLTSLLKEIKSIESNNIKVLDRLKISEFAQFQIDGQLFPLHQLSDSFDEFNVSLLSLNAEMEDLQEYRKLRQILLPIICDTSSFIHSKLKFKILVECQSVANALNSFNIPYNLIDHVFGVF